MKATLELTEREMNLLDAMVEKGLRQMLQHPSCTPEFEKEMFGLRSKISRSMQEAERQDQEKKGY